MYFKEKIPKLYILGAIFILFIILSSFIEILLLSVSNYRMIPFFVIIILLLIIYSYYWFHSHSKIGLLEDYITVYSIGRYNSMFDIEGKIKVLNGKIFIPYNQIQKIQVSSNKVYLKYKGILKFIVLEPINLEKFISALNTKIDEKKLNISIKFETTFEEELPLFKNNVLSNAPTIIIFVIIMFFPNAVGIYNFIESGFHDFLFELVTFTVTIALFYTIFAYKDLMFFSDNELIKITKLGNVNLGIEKIPYKEIVSIKKTKFRVDLKTKSRYINLVLVPAEKERFYEILNQKIKIKLN